MTHTNFFANFTASSPVLVDLALQSASQINNLLASDKTNVLEILHRIGRLQDLGCGSARKFSLPVRKNPKKISIESWLENWQCVKIGKGLRQEPWETESATAHQNSFCV